jgi:hypothetical protein
MPNLSLAEVGTASRNAMLSAKVYKTIRRVRRGDPLDEREQGILSRGADFLSEVVQGSLLIDRKPLEEKGFYADLKAYRHALSALVQLQREVAKEGSPVSKDVTGAFKAYRTALSNLSQGKQISEKRLEGLVKFFRILSDLFFRDVQAPPPVYREPF